MEKQNASISPGVIDYVTEVQWEWVPPLAWAGRIFTEAIALSELLDPLLARVNLALDTLNGWTVTVVDVHHPDHVTEYARLWLDPASGLPLQVDTYQVVQWPKLQLTERIANVSLLQLPTGAWLPIQAQRIQYRTVPRPHERVSGMAVDCQSILTDAAAVTPALFAAPFHTGERIYNAITDRYERYMPPENASTEAHNRPQVLTRRQSPNPAPQAPDANEPAAANDVSIPVVPKQTSSPTAVALSEDTVAEWTPPDLTPQDAPSVSHGKWIYPVILILVGLGALTYRQSRHRTPR
jgi:hypothetical protein